MLNQVDDSFNVNIEGLTLVQFRAIQGQSIRSRTGNQNEMSLITKLKTKDLFSFHKSRQSQTQTYKSTL